MTLGNDPVTGTATVVSSLQGWAAMPFSTQMSLGQWALFTGLIVVLVIFWLMILKELKGEV